MRPDEQMGTDDPRVDDRQGAVAQIVANLEAIFHALAAAHGPDFLDTTLTMPQAKVLYLVAVVGPLHMSEVAGRLGVTLSTVSGLVDRLVDGGLVERREDPRDRRQIIVSATGAGRGLVDRFQEVNVTSLRRLLDKVADEDLVTIERAFAALARAAGPSPVPQPAQPSPVPQPAQPSPVPQPAQSPAAASRSVS